MKLSEQAIDHPRIVYVITLLICLLTGLAVVFIPVQRTPAISKAVILIAVPHPGAQPSEVEEQITRKIEEKLQKLDRVDFVASSSMRGSSVTQVIFLDGVDADEARGRVKDLVDEVRRELPGGRDVEPVVTDIDFENTPLMLVNMVPPPGFDERSLKILAEEVQEELESVEGISSTQLFGGREREIHVNMDVDLAMEHGIAIDDVRAALAAYNSALPGGALETGEIDYQVRSDTKFRTLDDIRSAVVTSEQGRVIRVSDVATVEDTYRRLQNLAHLDGSDCATIIVYKESDINTLQTAQAVKDRVEELTEQYPQLKFSTTRDTSEEISVMFRVLGSSFVFGAMLVLVILGWAMGLRISFLVLTAVPLSSGIALVFLFAFGIPISNMVIFSFILVLGMVVDGAIIVAENIHRHIEMGKPPEQAAKDGINEVGLPVIMADLTTVAAYLPMLLVPGIMGDFMGVMPKVVSVALLGSVMVDHFLIPVLAARLFRQRAVSMTRAEMDDHIHENPFVRGYERVLRWALNNSWAIVLCTLLAIGWAGLMLGNIGFEFFPPSDRGQFEVKYELPLGNSIEQTLAAERVIVEPLRQMKKEGKEVIHFVSAIGSSEGLASRLENDPAVGPEFGTVMVQLHTPLDRDRHEDAVIAELRHKIDERLHLAPGMKYTIEEVEEGPPGGADVAVRLTGDEFDKLGRLGLLISEELKKVKGTVDASSDYRPENPEIVVSPNPLVLPFFGVSKSDIAAAIQTAINGDNRIEISLNDEDVIVRLQADEQHRQDRSALERLMVIGRDGRRTTIGEVSTVTRAVGVYGVNRYDRKRAVMARCNVVAPTMPDDVFVELRGRILRDLGFRPVPGNAMTYLGRPGTPAEGVRATFTGENEERDKNFAYLLWCMLIAVVLIFAILVLQFNSFRQPIIVLTTVPLSFVGVIAGMWMCQFPFSLATFIGLVSLAGVVVNDAIVVVDFTNQALARGRTLNEAVVEAAVHRLRPVILTTLTTIGGLLPLLLNLSGGAEFWQPLTGAVIFGLAFATVLTLLLIPVLYQLVYGPLGFVFDGLSRRLFGAKAAAAEATH